MWVKLFAQRNTTTGVASYSPINCLMHSGTCASLTIYIKGGLIRPLNEYSPTHHSCRCLIHLTFTDIASSKTTLCAQLTISCSYKLKLLHCSVWKLTNTVRTSRLEQLILYVTQQLNNANAILRERPESAKSLMHANIH